ncbi:Hypothetical protein ETEE_0613 [Edwardsiella anguillarum ET080813]|uniref:Uncharacterized protein n=1 Tax=Edwardsiella anguillarum ET080813 TaxID=667120 RepID=A0A076LN06_9GAMM|nr:Hypothetical protein ETEE_0613 [Edwardsiella anguillarum ET080813]
MDVDTPNTIILIINTYSHFYHQPSSIVDAIIFHNYGISDMGTMPIFFYFLICHVSYIGISTQTDAS